MRCPLSSDVVIRVTMLFRATLAVLVRGNVAIIGTETKSALQHQSTLRFDDVGRT